MPAEAPFETVYLRTHREQWPERFRETCQYVAAFAVDKKGFFYFTKHRIDSENSIILAPCCPLGEGEIFDEAVMNHLQDDLGIVGHVIDELDVIEDCKLLDPLSQTYRDCSIYYVVYLVTTTPRLSKKKMEKWGMEIVKLPYEDVVAQYEQQMGTPAGASITKQELPFLRQAKQRIDFKPEQPRMMSRPPAKPANPSQTLRTRWPWSREGPRGSASASRRSLPSAAPTSASSM